MMKKEITERLIEQQTRAADAAQRFHDFVCELENEYNVSFYFDQDGSYIMAYIRDITYDTEIRTDKRFLSNEILIDFIMHDYKPGTAAVVVNTSSFEYSVVIQNINLKWYGMIQRRVNTVIDILTKIYDNAHKKEDE